MRPEGRQERRLPRASAAFVCLPSSAASRDQKYPARRGDRVTKRQWERFVQTLRPELVLVAIKRVGKEQARTHFNALNSRRQFLASRQAASRG